MPNPESLTVDEHTFRRSFVNDISSMRLNGSHLKARVDEVFENPSVSFKLKSIIVDYLCSSPSVRELLLKRQNDNMFASAFEWAALNFSEPRLQKLVVHIPLSLFNNTIEKNPNLSWGVVTQASISYPHIAQNYNTKELLGSLVKAVPIPPGDFATAQMMVKEASYYGVPLDPTYAKVKEILGLDENLPNSWVKQLLGVN